MITEIITDRNNYHREIEEVRNDWTEEILNYLGVETEIFHQDVDEVDKYEYLLLNKIEIIDFPAFQALQIMFKGDLIAEWATPEFVLHEDENGEYFYKITVEHWSILEEEMDL